jgi:DNA mismatch endonuclease, patch repair protein
MVDVFTKQKRSEIMSGIRGSKNKATELKMISLFKKNHIKGWRRNYPLFGKPDFVFPKYKLAMFIDGCFWHGCPMHKGMPASNVEFWEKKLLRNKVRDILVTTTLQNRGWKVLRIWEHQLLKRNEPECLESVLRALGS